MSEPLRSLYDLDLDTSFVFRTDFALRPSTGRRLLQIMEGKVDERGTPLWRSRTGPRQIFERTDTGGVLRTRRSTFRIEPGCITVDAIDPARAFERMFHPLASLALASHNVVTFHAFVASGPTGGVAVMGRSGAGKTSLGTALLRRGFDLVSDDMLAIDSSGAVVPGPRFTRRAASPGEDRDPGGKVRVVVDGAERPEPLTGIVILSDRDTGTNRVERRMDAVRLLLDQIHTPFSIWNNTSHNNLMRAASLAEHVPVFTCERQYLPPADLADWVADEVVSARSCRA